LTLIGGSTQGGTLLKFYGASRADILNGSAVTFALTFASSVSGPTYTNSSGSSQLGIQFNHNINLWITGSGVVFVDWVISSPVFSAPIVYQTPTSTWNVVVSNTIDFQVQWSVASASNQIIQQYLILEQLF
jgi:hypothetical protein